MSTEGQLYTNLQNSIRLCATLTTVEYGHPKINQISSNKGFPVSPENREEDRKLDEYVLMTDAFRLCLHHLMEARKQLLLLGIQHELYEETPTIYNPNPAKPMPQELPLSAATKSNTSPVFGHKPKPSPSALEPYYNPRTDSDDEEETQADSEDI